MATVNEMFDEKQNETSFYLEVEGNKKESSGYVPTREGQYLGHIQDVETRVVEFKGYKARVYNFKVKVAPENKQNKYQFVEINGKTEEHDGSPYIGRVFRSSGIFRFLEPGKDDKFTANPTGNRGYLSLCEAVNIKCKETTKTVNKKKVKVKELPSLNTSDVEGMPVIATVKTGKAYTDKNGNNRNYFDVKWVNRWEDGKKITTGVDDEIPF